jgi:hypothetical protein
MRISRQAFKRHRRAGSNIGNIPIPLLYLTEPQGQRFVVGPKALPEGPGIRALFCKGILEGLLLEHSPLGPY